MTEEDILDVIENKRKHYENIYKYEISSILGAIQIEIIDKIIKELEVKND